MSDHGAKTDLATLLAVGGFDVLAHNAFTLLSVLALLIGALSRAAELWFKWRNSASVQAQLKLKYFREWEQSARDNNIS